MLAFHIVDRKVVAPGCVSYEIRTSSCLRVPKRARRINTVRTSDKVIQDSRRLSRCRVFSRSSWVVFVEHSFLLPICFRRERMET